MSTTVTSPTLGQVAADSGDGSDVGISATSKIAFYGAVPVVQRASSPLHAASVLSISSNTTIAASLTAWIMEVTATLVGLGIWV